MSFFLEVEISFRLSTSLRLKRRVIDTLGPVWQREETLSLHFYLDSRRRNVPTIRIICLLVYPFVGLTVDRVSSLSPWYSREEREFTPVRSFGKNRCLSRLTFPTLHDHLVTSFSSLTKWTPTPVLNWRSSKYLSVTHTYFIVRWDSRRDVIPSTFLYPF